MTTSSSDAKPVSVLFVCLGNICRSPMAEGVFRHMTRYELPDANSMIKTVDSCGTGAYHEGEPPDPRTMSVLKDHGITSEYYMHAARKFQYSDFAEFDYIFAMDDDNYTHLEQARKRLVKKGDLKDEDAGKVMLFGTYGKKGKEEVIDPYYGGRNGFEIAYDQMVRFSTGFIKQLEDRTKE